MKTSQLEFTVGCFVLAGLGALGWLAVKAGGGVLVGPRTYAVTARFANSGGLAPGSTVSIAGVPVGKVQSLVLTKDYAAVAELRLREDVLLPSDTLASIKTAGLLGDKYIALSPGAESDRISAGGTITETESAIDLESLISRFAFGSIGDEGKGEKK